ncbi:MAG: 4-hydroxy-tetrahydrodipicolinate reductase [Eubacteriales bacterium]|nr:4-hydroxy-tetrahydrodipicolinate reductase [Eubacteriales bacterium]MDD4106048.1 4-hydroxy-tetrahydrodipicolinate reductase [Eubacteriales bacterium]MDD4711365.1 4-hydroxy-tetrahydrodipicolinate reductase [Eubacteriales bacterium]
MSKLLLSGAGGRMGRILAREAAEFGFETVAGIDNRVQSYADFPIFASFNDINVSADVIVDFSAPAALPGLVAHAKNKGIPCVLCATGYTAQEDALAVELAQYVPVFRSANMSVGVYVLKALAGLAAKMLPGFDIEIVEKHHNQKADAPSGTALALFDAVAGPGAVAAYGRGKENGKRRPEEIGLHAVRGGTVAGEHDVGFYGSNETLRIVHSAQDRTIFALGALKAARFLLLREKGLYTMDDYMRNLSER